MDVTCQLRSNCKGTSKDQGASLLQGWERGWRASGAEKKERDVVPKKKSCMLLQAKCSLVASHRDNGGGKES